jgi:hypothetical protein
MTDISAGMGSSRIFTPYKNFIKGSNEGWRYCRVIMNTYIILVGKSEAIRPLGRPGRGVEWEDNTCQTGTY